MQKHFEKFLIQTWTSRLLDPRLLADNKKQCYSYLRARKFTLWRFIFAIFCDLTFWQICSGCLTQPRNICRRKYISNNQNSPIIFLLCAIYFRDILRFHFLANLHWVLDAASEDIADPVDVVANPGQEPGEVQQVPPGGRILGKKNKNKKLGKESESRISNFDNSNKRGQRQQKQQQTYVVVIATEVAAAAARLTITAATSTTTSTYKSSNANNINNYNCNDNINNKNSNNNSCNNFLSPDRTRSQPRSCSSFHHLKKTTDYFPIM